LRPTQTLEQMIPADLVDNFRFQFFGSKLWNLHGNSDCRSDGGRKCSENSAVGDSGATNPVRYAPARHARRAPPGAHDP
jgi:hypothetical protein